MFVISMLDYREREFNHPSDSTDSGKISHSAPSVENELLNYRCIFHASLLLHFVEEEYGEASKYECHEEKKVPM